VIATLVELRSQGRKVNWLIAFRVFLLILLIGALAYLALRIWRRKRNFGTTDAGVDFRPSIGFTHLDGWASLALLLLNKSDSNVWAEEIEIVLTDLIANEQASEASCHEILKIHQNVRPLDVLPISLVGTIYKAAGKPQRRYSCILSSMVRYRVGEEWFERPMQPYKLEMVDLTVVSNRCERWTKSEFKPQDQSRDSRTVDTKSK
jgi:hypothetical protein